MKEFHKLPRFIPHKPDASHKRIRAGSYELLAGELKLLTPKHATIYLTPTEMQILRELMISPDTIVNRNQLLSAIWNDNEENNSNIVNVYIRRLRMKLEDNADNPTHIISVRGSGYKFVA
jgi:DNA-binding response OmpR family regulator